ncbi:unnamed protein product [Mytilus edulis]|uniref:Uncharacterized protein n=1 Tax=Mytilus edulis TaxID=6550 RepID=A0A8S3Q1T7_MYTED|nr:unnamed protein product [Mytilus edulis]
MSLNIKNIYIFLHFKDKLKEEGTTDKENIKDEEYELTIQDDTFSVSDELKVLEGELEEVEQLEASMRAGNTLKNAGDVFKDTGLNCKLNGALGKEMKKDERRKKRETKKEEKRQKKLDREEEMIVKKYTKRIEMIMERYNKADKVQRKKDEKRRKQVEKHERKAQKNTVTSSILSFFRMFSCKKRQGKAVV